MVTLGGGRPRAVHNAHQRQRLACAARVPLRDLRPRHEGLLAQFPQEQCGEPATVFYGGIVLFTAYRARDGQVRAEVRRSVLRIEVASDAELQRAEPLR